MEPAAIQDFIQSSEIFSRGLSYYKSDCVARFIKSDGLIEASVAGSARKPYRVQIKLDKLGNPKAAFCTCPYSAGGFARCKHIAAVLIYDYEEYKIVPNPTKQLQEPVEDQVINLKSSRKAQRESYDFVRFLTRATGLPKEVEEGRRYSLVFIIEYSRDYYDKLWEIYPALRYIKKSGEGGRFERFKEGLISEPFSKTEKELLYRLSREETPIDELGSHLDFLIDNEISSLYLKERFDYRPVSFIQIQSIRIEFAIGAINDKEVYFAPIIRFLGERGQCTLEKNSAFRFFKKGFSFYLIGSGKIYYSRGNEAGADLLEVLVHRQKSFTYRDIMRLKGFFPEEGGGIEIESVRSELKIIDRVPKPFIEIGDSHGSVRVELWFSYEGIEVPMSEGGDFVPLKAENGAYSLLRRKREFERKMFDFFKTRFRHVLRQDFYSRAFTAQTGQPEFLAACGKEILDEGIEIRLKGKSYKITGSPGRVAVHVGSGIDWFDVKVGYQDDGGELRDIELDHSLLSGGLIRAGDRYIILTEKDIKKLRALLDEGMSRTGELKLSKFRYYFIDEFYNDIVNKQDPGIEKIRELNRRLKGFNEIASRKPPERFNGTLRDYQRAGYEWLFFLKDYGLNGCLADDMGLGKTVQVLALLQRLKEESRLKRSLVLVPVNTISNWESEIRRFAPELRYLLHYGAGRREVVERLDHCDFILSSYHTLRNDLALFKDTQFDYLILDESQCIKNPNSLVFKAVRTLKADHRLALTGTPVENSTLDLWSQMEFLNPGVLGGRKEFVNRFAKPIEKYGERNATEKLKKITRPFILRRKKEDVLEELPEKSEIVLYSSMGERQSSVYEQHRLFFREAVLEKIEREGVERSAIEIFSALLKLRQIALFPALADPKFKKVESCKFRQMREMVEELLEEDHKVVIFSQFVQCLEIIKEHFRVKMLNYAYIDGSINAKKRMEEIKRFQERKDYRVFLLSLKAGGVGINLTAADYVILFDPWWNPAVESQAIDRLHRIGQTNKVIAYKMVVKNTVEEKILELQERKKTLVSELITTESSFFKSLSKEDIAALFEGR